MIELFAGLRPEHEFFEEFGFISADDLPGFESILKRMERAGVESLLQPPRERLHDRRHARTWRQRPLPARCRHPLPGRRP